MPLLQTVQDLGRAKNALQNYLIQKLLIPKVYLDVNWNGRTVDILAIDRAGSGDVHVARALPIEQGMKINATFLLFASPSLLDNEPAKCVESLKSLSGHFRYIALVGYDPVSSSFDAAEDGLRGWLADDGVGRIGIFYVNLSDEEPSVKVILKAERFRSSKEITQLADEFVATHIPNWQIPDEDRL